PFQKWRQLAVRGGDVDRQRPACGRKAQRREVPRSEALEHGEEGRHASTRDFRDDGTQRGLGSVRYQELILQKAAAPVDPVPVAHEVERMEICGYRLEFAHSFAGCLAIPELVEGSHGQPIDDTLW